MDESLTHFIDISQNPVLYYIQLNILHDTALALAFLHTNGITHRDLSSNNVLVEQEVAQLSQEVQTKTQVIQQLRRQNGQLPTQQQLQQEVQQLKQQVQSSEELVAEFQLGMTDKLNSSKLN